MKKPSHFQPASSVKSYDKAAIVFVFEGLGWMKPGLCCPNSGFGREMPDNFAELRCILVCAKCSWSIAKSTRSI